MANDPRNVLSFFVYQRGIGTMAGILCCPTLGAP